ncbi:hypothetical protein DTO012A8_9637 [Penicillium roqueforti]|nr:hypothetical protein DTO012A8_9637 [Penicillium roqueforti]
MHIIRHQTAVIESTQNELQEIKHNQHVLQEQNEKLHEEVKALRAQVESAPAVTATRTWAAVAATGDNATSSLSHQKPAKEQNCVRISTQRASVDPRDNDNNDGNAFGRYLPTDTVNTHIRTALQSDAATQDAQVVGIGTTKTGYLFRFKNMESAQMARNNTMWLRKLGNITKPVKPRFGVVVCTKDSLRKASLCVYETRAPDKSLALLEPQPKRQKQLDLGELCTHHISWKAVDPQSEKYLQHEKGPTEKVQHTIEPTHEAEIKHVDQIYSGKDDLKSHETSPKRNAATVAGKPSISQRGCAAVENIPDWPRSASGFQPTELYAQMIPPTSLPPRPNFDLTIYGKQNCGPHTTHQLLLVLSYLFISSMLPADVGALMKVICRRHRDWEESFVLQRSELQGWLISVRKVLTKSDGLHTIALEEITLQTRYIMFVIGQNASPHSSFMAEIFQNEDPPTRPFGVRASIALICHAFEEIRADELEGYESMEIWTRDHKFLSTMASRLKISPLFGPEISLPHLQSMISSLQKAFQCEEIRVASTKVQKLRIENQSEVLEYFRRAFLAFNPLLLPKILDSLSGASEVPNRFDQKLLTNREKNLDRTNLASRLANIFTSIASERLNAGFQTICEIQQSEADKVVAIEMMHVKSFEEAYKSGEIGPTIVRVFHVPL